MLKWLLDSILGPLAGAGVLAGGFYSLYLAFLNSNALQGAVGGALILLGMWLVTRARRIKTGPRL
ncbi:MAG: hypothetical protein O6914_03945 [Chloroflexi bacterium]|nr:hypothetical protein [Chloroflexota bacterium]